MTGSRAEIFRYQITHDASLVRLKTSEWRQRATGSAFIQLEDMMHERNGIAIFKPGEDYPDHPAFRELNTVSLGNVRFPFGFFIVDEDGNRYVRPATEAERLELLLKVFPDGPSETLALLASATSETGGVVTFSATR